MFDSPIPIYARERWERAFATLLAHPDPDDLRAHLLLQLQSIAPDDRFGLVELRRDVEATLALISPGGQRAKHGCH